MDAVKPASSHILGVRVDPVTRHDLETEIKHLLDSGQKRLLLNVNVNCLNQASELSWLREFLNHAYIVFCDGYGVKLGGFLLGNHIPERITFGDWIYPLCSFASQNGYRMFFLGAKPGVAEKAASRLQELNPNVRIVGTHHGYFDKTHDSVENKTVMKMINEARPDILFVCFGMPLQEQWLRENWDLLDVNIGLTGGAVLDYVAGVLKRPPQWMNDSGLEWLGRLILEPRRLWKRYLFGIPIFFWRILKQRVGLSDP
ncbi:MAG: glycosyltransferase [Acidobacteria bacterium]|nr:MAG: glycosyltransferase [Acidobacteriota bacterium]